MSRDLNLETLEIYKLAEELADLVWDVVKRWQNLPRDTVGKQLVRAADSVGANIAEGYGRFTYKDRCRFLHIARGSLYETRFWLRRAHRRQLLDEEATPRLTHLLDELPPKLNGYLRSLRPKSRVTTPDSPH